MTTAYTSLLGLALPVTGELSGTWGDTVNNSITSLLDSAVAGTTTISSDADVTLTTTTGASNTSREAILLWTAGGTVTRTITAPAQSKTYIVINKTSSTQSIKLVGAGPTTGITIVAGESAVCAWNGLDFIKISNISGAGTFTNLTVTGNTILGDASADTVTVNGTLTSNLIFTDNTYDIGASGATRPRTGYFGTSVFAPLVDATNLEVTNIKALDSTASISIASTTGIATFSKATIVETTDNTNAALRITQLGTGNALLVEDSANPDATPFAIDTSGNVLVGITTAQTISGITPAFQQLGAGNYSGMWSGKYSANSSANFIYLSKSRSATVGTNTIVQSGDDLGTISFYGADGTNLIEAAGILGEVDGTPGTNDMPGRLVFSTTADGASTPTEAMRINSAQNVSIGTSAASAGTTLRLSKSITGAVESYGILNNGTIQSDVTSQANIFTSNTNTVASAFTLASLRHFYVNQGTVGATSAITNQYGFFAESGMTGATNNYGFYGDLALGTGRYNLYMNGTADNYLAGKTGIGGTASVGQILRVGGSLTGSTSSRQVIANGIVASDVTARADSFYSVPQTAASAFTLGILSHYHASQGTIGSTSAVTTQIGFEADSSITGATTNIGFYGDIAAASGRWNFYASGTASNYMAGSLGIGTTTLTARALGIASTITGGVNGYGILSSATSASDVTTAFSNFQSQPITQAASFTLGSLYHFNAGTATIGAGSTVTNQYGFVAGSGMTGATNNYGFFGNIASGTGRYNFYANGTADNYFAGNVGIGTTAPLTALNVNGTGGELIRISVTADGATQQEPALGFATGVTNTHPATKISALEFDASDSRASMLFYTRDTNSDVAPTERMRIDYNGNVLIGTATSPAGTKELVLGGDYIEGVVAIGNSATAKTISLANGTFQTVTMTGNCTFTMPTAIAGKSFILIVSTGAGSFTGTFTSVKWPNNTAPTLTTTATRWDILTFASDGTNWYGNFAQAYQ